MIADNRLTIDRKQYQRRYQILVSLSSPLPVPEELQPCLTSREMQSTWVEVVLCLSQDRQLKQGSPSTQHGILRYNEGQERQNMENVEKAERRDVTGRLHDCICAKRVCVRLIKHLNAGGDGGGPAEVGGRWH